MAAYTSPTIEQIVNWGGISADALGKTDDELDALLDELLPQAEAEVKARVGATYFEGVLEEYQVALLQEAAARATTARFLDAPEVRRLTGTHEPVLSEESEAYEARIEGLLTRSKELCDLVIVSRATAGEPADVPAEVQTVRHSFGAASGRRRPTFTTRKVW
ncbi:MAG TPA: hypothetical protein PLE61_15325 [Vicinamibacterales bacterium]|nr:hypothetical protein [Vicinamibacterales bacterium]